MQCNQRFSAQIWGEKKRDIIIVGAGGVGSPLARNLSRIGHNLFVWDFDRVEIQNVGTQLYFTDQVGLAKTAALSQTLARSSENRNFTLFNEPYTNNSMTGPIVISCVDHMDMQGNNEAGRNEIFERWAAQKHKALFMDARLSVDSMYVYVVNSKSRIEQYRSEKKSDLEIPDAPCNDSQAPHMADFLASYMIILFNQLQFNAHHGQKLLKPAYKHYYNATANTWSTV